jgi:hypothetical protein
MMKVSRTVLPDEKAIMEDVVVDTNLEWAASLLFCWGPALLLPGSFRLWLGKILASELDVMKVGTSLSVSCMYGKLEPFVKTQLVVKCLTKVGVKWSLPAAGLGGLFLVKLLGEPKFRILCVR